MAVRDVVPKTNKPKDPSVLDAMDLLGQRWVLRIVWELESEAGAVGFLDLRRRMGNCSSSVLAARMAMLVERGLIEKLPDKQYALTDRGVALGHALRPLWRWAIEQS